jgi:hypothetical protein
LGITRSRLADPCDGLGEVPRRPDARAAVKCILYGSSIIVPCSGEGDVVRVVVDGIGNACEPIPSDKGNSARPATLHNELEISIGIVGPDAAPIAGWKWIDHRITGGEWLTKSVSVGRNAAHSGLESNVIGGIKNRIAKRSEEGVGRKSRCLISRGGD